MSTREEMQKAREATIYAAAQSMIGADAIIKMLDTAPNHDARNDAILMACVLYGQACSGMLSVLISTLPVPSTVTNAQAQEAIKDRPTTGQYL